MSPRHPATARFAAIALLLVYGWLQFGTLAVTSPTMDEPNHLVSGYAFLTRGDTRIQLNGPILPNAIGALPLLLEPKLDLTPADDPRWDANDYNDIADQFVWGNTASPFRIVYMARVPFMMIGWLLGALIFRWARERGGSRAGLFALALYVFCPNLLAHSRFVMTDFAPTAFTAFALYTFERSRHRPERRAGWLASGVTLGLVLASKFSLVMLIPAMIVLTLIDNRLKRPSEKPSGGGSVRGLPVGHAGVPGMAARPVTSRNIGRASAQLAVIVFIAAITVWGVYGFRVAPVSPGGLPVPAPGYWSEVESARYYLNQSWPNYLFGQTSATGWWYYFPIAFVLKTPVPALLLLIAALVRTALTRSWRRDAIFLLPGLLIFAGLLFSTNDLGYRYLLPLLPLIFVYVADLASGLPTKVSAPTLRLLRPTRLLAAVLLLAWHILGTLNIYPYYLTFFNEIAGGPDRGRYVLSDSNIDWGQDLVGLKHYIDQHGIDRIKLSYFGIAHPTAYGMKTDPLPPIRTAMHDQGSWWLHTYYPTDPAPGIYAISVANLMGGIWIDPQTFAFFRDRKPDSTIGNSIYVYTIPALGTPVDLSLSGLQIEQIDPETYHRFDTNDVRPRWFDATTSLIAAPGPSWIAIAARQTLPAELTALLDGITPEARTQTIDDHQPYQLYHFNLGARILEAASRSAQVANGVQLPVKFGETAELLGYTLAKLSEASQGLTLITYWRAGEHVITPLQLFVHAVRPDGQIVAQEDRLDAPAFGWRPGDRVVQVIRLDVPPGSGSLQIEIGLYNRDSGDRLPVLVNGQEIDRRLLLKQIEIK